MAMPEHRNSNYSLFISSFALGSGVEQTCDLDVGGLSPKLIFLPLSGVSLNRSLKEEHHF